MPPSDHRRTTPRAGRPTHPTGTAALLIAGVTLAIIALAVLTTFGLG